MLERVQVGERKLTEYREIISDTLFGEVEAAAALLAGRRVLHINATSQGGGVAEILASYVLLLRGLGIKAEWQVTQSAPAGFFDITKRIHNGLQGEAVGLSVADWRLYELFNQELAEQVDLRAWDYIFVHDPQPAAIRQFTGGKAGARWIWRYHGDASRPDAAVAEQMRRYVQPYDGAIFSLPEYFFDGYHPKRLEAIPVAIDPLADKNLPIDPDEAGSVLARFGVDVARPVVAQVSRFDKWKDPLGVIEAWRLARHEVPDLQLVLVGNVAGDDPEGPEILRQVKLVSAGETGLFIIEEPSAEQVKAVQAGVNVILQKSLREGFGLTVTEALWAGTPVIGGDVGGIKLQIEDGESGFLVSSVEETARRIVELVQDPERARAMGAYGRAQVRQKFLLPRLVRDDLRFMSGI